MATRWATSPGIALMGTDAPSHITAWARAAEAAGLGSAWIIEDYFHPGAYALAAAAAAVTARLAIGLGVVNPYTRHPALLAMETAALAGIAPGRVVLGLGSSNRHWIEAQMGIPFKAPSAVCASVSRSSGACSRASGSPFAARSSRSMASSSSGARPRRCPCCSA